MLQILLLGMPRSALAQLCQHLPMQDPLSSAYFPQIAQTNVFSLPTSAGAGNMQIDLEGNDHHPK